MLVLCSGLIFREVGSQHFWELITMSLKLLNLISPVSPAVLFCRLSFGSAEQSTQLHKRQGRHRRGVVLGRPRNPEFRIDLNFHGTYCNAWWKLVFSLHCACWLQGEFKFMVLYRLLATILFLQLDLAKLVFVICICYMCVDMRAS